VIFIYILIVYPVSMNCH